MDLKELLKRCALEIVPEFQIDEYNKNILNLILYYAAGVEEFETYQTATFQTEQRYLGRGLWFSGNYGCGKTDLMRILQRCLNRMNSPRKFPMVSMIEFSRSYGKAEDLLTRYQGRPLFIDEFGMIDSQTGLRKYEVITNYGTKMDLGEMLILSRYNDFKMGIPTHITTNLKKTELEQQYDPRTVSRILEMFNIIPVTGPDRRPTARPRVSIPPQPEPTHKAHELIPLLLQNFPKEASGIIQAVEKMASQGKPKKPGLEIKPETHEGFMARFTARLPDTDTAELLNLHREAQTALNPEVAKVIEAELTKRNETFKPYQSRTGKAA